MESKLIVYTVLAITLGYIFMSTIPGQLAPPRFESVLPETESVKTPNHDEPKTSAEETFGADSTMDSAREAADADETRVARDSLIEEYLLAGTLILNLSIAFGVYMLARRRFI